MHRAVPVVVPLVREGTLRTTRSVVLPGVVAMVVLGGLLTAMVPPTVSAAAADPHPVRPQVQGCGWPGWTGRPLPSCARRTLAPIRRC